ncbi:hypothetical protein CR194_09670 [Salipaludibacillus keqinensis]|uniref:DUF456 domain-containing protein n=1 Tax=Salipaludibacillus keqinensis TaxID=2045207 RepID=A0A323THM5_9BACI|nr:DUF456 domain-containing protein [Salipaludibacillus keqinensis]PYZ93434.1 hypothetical protein CR194_09670 [Salipaludibacillus keqinensis]
MDVIIWLVIIFLFVLSFIGLLYPILPSVLLLWGGVALYYFFIDTGELSWWTWTSFLALTIVIFIADYVASMYFVKKYGASKKGMTAATVGLIVGSFIIPPLGIFVVPFALVLLVEMMQNQSFERSVKVAVGTLLGFLTSTFAKGFIQFVLIAIFLIDIWLL